MATPEDISIRAEINLLIARRPFLPFSIIMASGSKYDIGVRDAVTVGRSVIAIYPHSGGQHLLHERQICEVNISGEKP